MSLAAWQNEPEQGVRWFTKEEEAKISRHCSSKGNSGWGGRAMYYPRRPVVDVGKWFADWKAKLTSMERAEGL